MRNTRFPESGRSWAEIRDEMLRERDGDLEWATRKSFKPAYYAGDELVAIANEAYQLYITDNALYAHSAFPSLARYERDVMAMLHEMLNAPVDAGGALTTGGTESNFMAVKTARDWARSTKPQISSPNMVVPRTAHPSFDKAAGMLGIEVRRAAGSIDFKADVPAMAALVDNDTIMIVASAPPYPYGETDPVQAISGVAKEADLWLHVDGCLGGFILPFAREFDDSIPDFDFTIDAVSSMSADLHKYGYAAKGISALVLRDVELEQYQHVSFDDWPSGLYSTPGVAGSRSGGALASAWAVMNHLGWQGYREIVRAHLDIRTQFIDTIEDAKGFYVVAQPHAYNFAFASTEVDMFAVADGLGERGWTLARSNEPASVQLMINRIHEDVAEEFAADLGAVAEAVRTGQIVASDSPAIYAT